MNNEIVKGVEQCIQNIGLVFNQEQMELSDYIEDSIAFVGFVIELEQYFDIEIDDDYFSQNRLVTIYDVYEMIEDLKARKDAEQI